VTDPENPFPDSKVRKSAQHRTPEQREVGLETTYCAETVAVTYEDMGLLVTEKIRTGLTLAGSGVPIRCR
jgi:hypothetical protein